MESEKRATFVACFKGTVGDFLDTSYEGWLEQMCQNYDRPCS